MQRATEATLSAAPFDERIARPCPAVPRTWARELLAVDEPLRKLIHDGAAESELTDAATRNGMVPLREDGLRWVAEGVTSLEEVLRVTRD